MSIPDQNKMLHDLFRHAVNQTPADNKPHLIDDDELLLRWVEGDITQDEHAAIVKHLDECPPCRQEIAAMTKAGALELAESEEKTLTISTATATVAPQRRLVWTAFAVAASLLLAAWIWVPSRSDSNELLAFARRDLAAGNAEAALKQATELLEQPLDPAIADRVQRFQKNLKIQTERGIPSEYALDLHGALDDPAYTPTKAMWNDPVVDRYEKELEQALADFPDDVPLRLNYGQFYLEQGNYTKARQQFEKVLAENDRNPRAHLGLGLVAFNASPIRTRSLTPDPPDYKRALAQFEKVLNLTPNNVAAHINAAMCLDELKRPEKSLKHWRRAAELTTDEKQRAWIVDRIKGLEVPGDPATIMKSTSD